MDLTSMGKHLAALRRSRNLTQEALGEKLGVSNKTVSRWENGHCAPDLDMLQVLSQFYGVSVQALLDGEAPVSPQADAPAPVKAPKPPQPFDTAARMRYWKQKWCKEHATGLVLLALCILGVMAFGALRGLPALIALGVLAGFMGYLVMRNRMMGYVEARAFDVDVSGAETDKPDV